MQQQTKQSASTADIHKLYEISVQSPEADVDFIDRAFNHRYAKDGRRATDLREDFCGTGVFACEWVKKSPEHRAWGIDLDKDTMKWGREHHIAKLPKDAQKRVSLLKGDVRDGLDQKVDVITAQNFSYMLLKEPDDLIAYFKTCRKNLRKRGALVLDIYGGPESQIPAEEETEHEDEGFSYVWDQISFDPTTHIAECAIHFRFPDGSEMKDAFRYHWRLWTIPELRHFLTLAGFAHVEVFWEGTDEEGEGDGNFEPVRGCVENEEAWIAYVVAYTK